MSSCVLEVPEGRIVNEDLYICTKQVMPPIVQRINEREHLLLMHWVVRLGLVNLVGSAGDEPRQTLSIQLIQSRSHTDIGSIRVE